MAKQEKEEVIFELKVEPGDALSDMEKLKKSILQTKEEQKGLNKALKDGDITLDEYVKDSVRLEAILKKQQSSYNNVQKSVTGVKTQLDKLIISNEKISKDLKKTSQSFQDVAGKINVAGVNVGDITTKMTGFLNPATAAVGVVTALGAAYASSTTGARDLAIAQDTLTASVGIATESFGDFISTVLGDDSGRGPLELMADAILFRINPALAAMAGIASDAKEQLRDLAISRAFAQGFAKEDERAAELQRRIRDDEAKSVGERLAAADQINALFERSAERTVVIIQAQIEAIKQSTIGYENNREAQLQVAQLTAEIKDKEEEITGKLTENVAARQKILDLQQEEFRALAAEGKAGGIDTGGVKTTDATGDSIRAQANAQIQAAEYLNQVLDKLGKERAENERKNAADELAAREYADQARLDSAVAVTASIAGLFKEGSDLQKAFALTSIGIDTAQAIAALTAASEGNPANAVTFGGAGIAQYAAGIVRILSNIAAASQYLGGRAAGGGDFYTKGPTMLMVGDNPGGVERVTVEPISGRGNTVINPYSNLVAMAGGGTLTAFNDGGLSVNSLTSSINESVMQQNMIKKAMSNMPRPIVAVRDVKRGLDKVSVKDKVSKGK